jgi:hypothetical protein
MALTYEENIRRMEARRRGEEKSYLHVTFLCLGHVEREKILEAGYACRAMENWMARGLEYKVKNHPVTLPRVGALARVLQNRQTRVNAARLLSWR